MRHLRMISIVGAIAVLIATGSFLRPARATQEPTSLMQMLEEWKYPDSKMLGASMSDGGNPDIVDTKCRAILTTPDSFEAVVRFYNEKTGEASNKAAEARAVTTQEDSKDRPLAVRIISVHRAEVSTTLVISRGEKEKETHIAWSQYRTFPKAR
jgi:hypothetical protein